MLRREEHLQYSWTQEITIYSESSVISQKEWYYSGQKYNKVKTASTIEEAYSEKSLRRERTKNLVQYLLESLREGLGENWTIFKT